MQSSDRSVGGFEPRVCSGTCTTTHAGVFAQHLRDSVQRSFGGSGFDSDSWDNRESFNLIWKHSLMIVSDNSAYQNYEEEAPSYS